MCLIFSFMFKIISQTLFARSIIVLVKEVEKGLIKNESEIKKMRNLGKVLASIFEELKKEIKPNVDSYDIEKLFLNLCEKNNVNPSCKGYVEGSLPPFPTGLCLSINNQSVHCFPKKGVILKEGDIVNIDTVIDSDGLYVDSAHCFPVGNVDEEVLKFVKTTEKALYNAIKKVKNNTRIGAISNTLQKTMEKEGFNVLRDFEGHGIGYSMHEYPEIPCYGEKHDGPKLKEGMTICIEALTCEGNSKVVSTGGWETKMADGRNFCIFEHTVLVQKNGFEIFT